MKHVILVTIAAGLLGSGSAFGQASPPTALGSVRLTQRVIADGKPLPAGTYQVRLTADTPTPVAGQSPNGERWVEFVSNGQVAGRELAIVLSRDDIINLPRA